MLLAFGPKFGSVSEVFWAGPKLFGSKYSTVPTAEILSGNNARAWVSMDFT